MMMMLSYSLCFLVLASVIVTCNGIVGSNECSTRNGFMDYESLKRKAAQGFTGAGNMYDIKLLKREIWFIPDMKFTCAGTIKGVYLAGLVRPQSDVYPAFDIWLNTSAYSSSIYPELQIWRNTSNNSRYSELVSSQQIKINPGSIGNKVFFYYEFPTAMSFAVNDYIGIYQPSDNSTLQLAYDISSDAPDAMIIRTFNGKMFTFDNTLNNVAIVNRQSLLLNPKLSMSCLERATTIDKVKTRSLYVTPLVSHDKQLRLFPGINFTCNGYITKWIVGAVIGSGQSLVPHFQIWRLNTNQQYELVHCYYLMGNSISPFDNVYVYTPNSPLAVKSGDIFAVYQPGINQSQFILLYQQNNGPTNLVLNAEFETDDDGDTPSLIMQSNLVSTRNDFPLVSFEFVISLPSTTASSVASSSSTSSASITAPSTVSLSISTTSLLASTTLHSYPATAATSYTPSLSTVANGPTSSSSLNLLIIIISSVVAVIVLFLIILIIIILAVLFKRQRRVDEATPAVVTVARSEPCYEVCISTGNNLSYGVLPISLRQNVSYTKPSNISCKHNMSYVNSCKKKPILPPPHQSSVNPAANSNQLTDSYEYVQPYILPVTIKDDSTTTGSNTYY